MKEIWRNLDGPPKNKELWSYVVNFEFSRPKSSLNTHCLSPALKKSTSVKSIAKNLLMRATCQSSMRTVSSKPLYESSCQLHVLTLIAQNTNLSIVVSVVFCLSYNEV